jgi:hypothetical protein
MPLFHFDVQRDHRSFPDEEGMHLASLEAAQLEATSTAAELLKGAACVAGCKVTVSVRDGSPAPIFFVDATLAARVA